MKSPYITPQTTLISLSPAHFLMVSGGEGEGAKGNVNNTPENGVTAF